MNIYTAWLFIASAALPQVCASYDNPREDLSTGSPDTFGSLNIGFGQFVMPTSGRLGNFPNGYDLGLLGFGMPLDIWFPTQAAVGIQANYVIDGAPLAIAQGLGGLIPQDCNVGLPFSLNAGPDNQVLQSLSFSFNDSTQAVFPDPTVPYPLLVFSHGSGASSGAYIEIMKKLASHGFVVVAMNHPGNTAFDDVGGTKDPDFPTISCNRAKDVRNVIDFMTSTGIGANWPLQFPVNIDTSKIAVMGHSFGGFTALTTVLGYGKSVGDSRECPFTDGTDISQPDSRVGVAITMAQASFDPVKEENVFMQEEIAELDADVLVLSSGEDARVPAHLHVDNIFPGIESQSDTSMRVEMINGGHISGYVDVCSGSDSYDGILSLANTQPGVDLCTGLISTIAGFIIASLGPNQVEGCPDTDNAQPNLPSTEIAQEIVSTYSISYLKSQLLGEEAYEEFLEDDLLEVFGSGVVDEIDQTTSVFFDDDADSSSSSEGV